MTLPAGGRVVFRVLRAVLALVVLVVAYIVIRRYADYLNELLTAGP